eukprot:gene10030-biopygen8395
MTPSGSSSIAHGDVVGVQNRLDSGDVGMIAERFHRARNDGATADGARVRRTRRSVTAPAIPSSKPLHIGGIELANRVVLAPMTGITDVPFRRQVAGLGAGLVVSEMTASADLVNGRPMSVLRVEATGLGPHVVQLAGCEARWMGYKLPKLLATIGAKS